MKGQKNKKGAPLRTDFGLGGADIVTINQARERALEYRRIDQPEVTMCIAPIWTEKHETAKPLAQRLKVVLDVARSKGFRSGENPVTFVKEAQVLPKVKVKVKPHKAMAWQEVPAFYADLASRNAMAANALRFTCLTVSDKPGVIQRYTFQRRAKP